MWESRRAYLLPIVLGILVGACSDDGDASTGAGSGAGGDGGAGTTTGTGGDATSTGGGNTGPGGSGGGIATVHGGVFVTEIPTTPGSFLYAASAAFTEGSEPDSCAGADATEGSCCLFTEEAVPEPPQSEDAGDIALADPMGLLATLSFDPESNGYFGVQWTNSWNPGDAISVTATGATVPAFELSRPTPARLADLTPAWGDADTWTISKSQDWVLSWTPDANATQMELLLVVEEDVAGFPLRAGIYCEAPETDGSLTVPASLLSYVEAGDVCAVCGLTRRGITKETVEGAEVQLALSTMTNGPVVFVE